VAAAPAAAVPPAGCLTFAAVKAAHPTEEGMDPCEPHTDEDLNSDGLPELTMSCQVGMKSFVHTVYAQEPKDCFRQIAQLEGYWQVVKGQAGPGGFLDLSLMGEEDAELLYKYDPATRTYRPEGEPGAAPAGPAPTVQLPKAALRLSGLTGIAVGEPGFTGDMPTCCLDCDPLVPVLRTFERSTAAWAQPIDAAALRIAAGNLRNTRWAEYVAETYSDKARKGFVAATAALAGALEETAAALDAGDGQAGKRADGVARAVTKLLAAAGKLGEESTAYCNHD
jgi:hypothetical protein